MKIRVPIVTYTAADELANPDNTAGTYSTLFEGVSGYLESIQYIKPATDPLTDTVTIGVFLFTEVTTNPDFPLMIKTGATTSFLSPVRHQAVDEAALDITDLYEPIYLSNDTILVVIGDEEDGSAGGLTGTVVLRFSQRDPVRR